MVAYLGARIANIRSNYVNRYWFFSEIAIIVPTDVFRKSGPILRASHSCGVTRTEYHRNNITHRV